MKARRGRLRRQAGFTLMEMLVVLAIVASITLQRMQTDMQDAREASARANATKMATYVSAVRKFAAENPGAATGTQTGVDWLRDSSCGGSASKPYLPCGTGMTLSYGQTYTANIASAGSGLQIDVTFGAPEIGGDPKPKLAAIMASNANGATGTAQDPSQDTFFSFDADVSTGEVTATVNSNASLDSWLRRDGSNKMAGDLDMDDNEIQNAEKVTSNATGVAFDAPQGSINIDAATIDSEIDWGTVTASGDGSGALSIQGQGGNTGQLDVEGEVSAFNGDHDLSETVQNVSIEPHGEAVAKPSCPASRTPQIFTAAALADDGGNAVYGVQTWASDGGASWVVQMAVRDDAGNWDAPANPGKNRILVVTKCT